METFEQIKCSKCGFMNIKGTRICSKCRTNIDAYKKSCPKCGKVNSNNVKRCIRCKFDFTKKKKTIWYNLIISILIVIGLLLLTYFDDNGIVEKFNLGLKVIAGFIIFVLVVKIFTYGEKDKVTYNVEEEIANDQKVINIMKKWSNIAILIGAILVLGFLIYYYFIR